MHSASRDQGELCGKVLDRCGDHAVCNIGPDIFARHSRINGVLAQAGRDAGYAALLEQVVPELALKRLKDGRHAIEDAYLDVELFGHLHAPDRLLDATVRHPAAKRIVSRAARLAGAAASEGVRCKERRYPTSGGKSVIPCAFETWGFVDGKAVALLEELAVLATQRQKDRGLAPMRWKRRWLTMISVGLALDAGKAILNAMPAHSRPCYIQPREL